MMDKRFQNSTDADPARAGLASAALNRRRGLLAAALIGYVVCVIYITLLSRTPSLLRGFKGLFVTWREWLGGNRATGREMLENLILFIPFGCLTASLARACGTQRGRGAVLTVLAGLACSLAIECLQYYTGRGWFDVDDLLHNSLGAGLGCLAAYGAEALLPETKRAGRVLRFGVLPVLLLAAGLLGCLLMDDMVRMSNLHADQFWFSVEEVEGDGFSGRCYLYDRPTPDLRLYLVSGSETVEAEVTREGETFTATAPRSGAQYELRVRFRGYVTLSTGVYLRGGQVEYVAGEQPEPVSMEDAPFLDGAALKAYSAERDIYVYQLGGSLVWLVGPEIAPDMELVCQLKSSEPEKLPENRRKHGFDNLGFLPTEPNARAGEYRCYEIVLPTTYPISSVTVGLDPGSGVVWREALRP